MADQLSSTLPLHRAVEEEVLTLDCMYGECGHEEDAECLTNMTVCDTCREPWEDDADYELFVAWPCELAPSSPDSGSDQ